MRAGRLLAIIISGVVLLGGGYAAWKLNHDKEIYGQRNREAELRATLAQMRAAIRQFHDDQDRYPRTLDELVPKYLPRIPNDPLTNSPSWRVSTEQVVRPNTDFRVIPSSAREETFVIDVHSGAEPPYSGW